jgi:hypothetical protein
MLPVIEALSKTRGADEKISPVLGRLRNGRIGEQCAEILVRFGPFEDEDDLRVGEINVMVLEPGERGVKRRTILDQALHSAI